MHQRSREGRRRNAARRHERRARNERGRRTRAEGVGFMAAFEALCGNWVPRLGRRRGRKPRVAVKSVVAALVFHVMQHAGTLAEHFAWLLQDSLCDSACSDRRQRLPWQVFEELMRHALRPLVRVRGDPGSFWRGWRLVALDGTQFSLSNTPQAEGVLPKAKTRRGRAAFAKLGTSVLLELGLHNPLAAAIGRQGESEWVLARALIARLPRRALLLADRLHGCPAFLAEAAAGCERVGSAFLVRARSQCEVRTLCRYKDGSRLVEAPVRRPERPATILRWMRVREIRAQVARPGHRTQTLRLWTSLLDPRAAPADELARLYSQRWEHELYYRNLKRQLRKTDLLQSHTVETAAQEIAAFVLASAVLARERQRAAKGGAGLRISFVKVLELMRPLWLTLALGSDVLTDAQKHTLTTRFLNCASHCLTAPRRARSCPRALRQSMSAWPRLLKAVSYYGPVSFTIT